MVTMDAPGHFRARNLNMKEFAEGLQANVLDRPVLDQTGLSGRFDFTLSWTPDEFQFPNVDVKAPPADNNAGLPGSC